MLVMNLVAAIFFLSFACAHFGCTDSHTRVHAIPAVCIRTLEWIDTFFFLVWHSWFPFFFFSKLVFLYGFYLFFSSLFFTTRGPVPSNVTTNPIVKGPKTRSFRFVLECWWDGADTKDVNCLFFFSGEDEKKGSLSKRESVVVVNGFFSLL